jgi:hypothetical protein
MNILRLFNLRRGRLFGRLLFSAHLPCCFIRLVVNEESVREHRVFRGEMFPYIGLVPKDHDRLQSLLWSVVRGARLEQAVIS